MSYRGFKRLVGETSLERKCRMLLGGGVLVLILLSFFAYGYQTEKLVWDQTKLTGQLNVNSFLLRRHRNLAPLLANSSDRPDLTNVKGREDLDWFLPEEEQKYTARLLRPGATNLQYLHRYAWEPKRLEEMQKGLMNEYSDSKQINKVFYYLRAIRLQASCCACHATETDKKLGQPDLKEGDFIGAVSVEIPLEKTELAINVNRTVLLSFAIITAILTMVFTYVTIRYVIVKPVAHLKDVSEEIASGNVDIRSSIQTGDEFQELSQAFNRMLRSLVSMQDELKRVNTDLDNRLDELARANMALFEMNRLKSDFLATISHELRTPLNSILGFGDLLAEATTLQPKQQRWVQNIQTSGKLLLQMINDILDLAKLEAGKMKVQVEEFSLRDMIEAQLQMFRPLADKKNISLSSEIEASIPILRQDSRKLEQILSNLLSNAIKFTPEGGLIIVRCKADRAHVVICVIDNGVGIPEEDQKLIFEKFRQVERTLTRNHGGTGLGLSIVRELVKLLGGDEVQLESELGRGSTFQIRIPMHLAPQQQAELALGDEPIDMDTTRINEPRYFSSREKNAVNESTGAST